MTDRVGQQLGNYHLVRLLGRGGFAEVYLGEHVRLGTQAAIKVLQAHLASQEIEHFQSEARTIAHLDHPSIVRVLDFDVIEGTPFLVMSYAPFGTLRQRHPKGLPVPIEFIIAYVKQIANALHYAHTEQVIHRDIKPENMLIGRRNEILLSDFGIATIAQSSRYQSTQTIVGTVTYMAPEQIQGKPRPASDQYALGITTYEWLSGHRPFQGSFTEIATQHLFVLPPPLREKLPRIAPALEAVVMTALEKDPHKRFATIQAFATALEQAVAEAQTLPSLRSGNTHALSDRGFSSSTKLPDSLSVESSFPPTVGVAPPTREPARGTLFPCVYRGHSEPVSSVAWSADSTHIASACDDGTVHVWTVPDAKPILIYRGHSGPVSSVSWSLDNTQIASAGSDKTVQIWDATTGHCLFTYRAHLDAVWSAAWSPEGDCLASASSDQTVHVWDARTGALVFRCEGVADSGWCLAWSPDDDYLAFQRNTNEVYLCDPIDGHKRRIYRGHSDRVMAIAWSPDGKMIASGAEDKTVQLWNAAKGRKLLTYSGHSDSVLAVAWSPDGAYVVSAGDDQTVQVWVAATGREVYTYRGHSAGVIAVAWSPDRRYVASAGEDQTVHVWTMP